jgi:hypothetical protein
LQESEPLSLNSARHQGNVDDLSSLMKADSIENGNKIHGFVACLAKPQAVPDPGRVPVSHKKSSRVFFHPLI